MSNTTVTVIALVVAVLGFAAGRYSASVSEPAVMVSESADQPEASNPIRDAVMVPDPMARAARLATLLPTLGAESAPLAAAVIHARDLDLGAVELVLLVEFWSSHEPEAAARWALTRAPTAYRSAVTLPAVEAWARSDPQAALELVKVVNLVPGPNSKAAYISLVRGWVDSGQPGLEEYIQSLGVSFERQRALVAFIRRRIQREGVDSVMRWAEAIPDEDKRYKIAVFRQLGSELAQLDRAAAIRWCDAHCDGPYGSMMAQLVAQRWAAQDGPAAMQWVSQRPPGEEQKRAAEGAWRGFWQSDPEGFISWAAERFPDGVEPWFEPNVRLYAGALGRRDPEAAIGWALQIEDETARERVLTNVARRWRSRDVAAAEAWLERSPLSEEAREQARLPAKQAAAEGGAAGEAAPVEVEAPL